MSGMIPVVRQRPCAIPSVRWVLLSLCIVLLFSAGPGANAQRLRSRNGKTLSIDLIFLKDHPVQKAIEDDVRASLAEIGVSVVPKPLSKEEWNTAAQSGNFHLAFSETWGPPYDPHSFVASFKVPNEAEHAALQGMVKPMTKVDLDNNITSVLRSIDNATQSATWEAILTNLHQAAIFLPLSYMRNPAVINQRLRGFEFGSQQFDIPMVDVSVVTGPKNVTIAPASQTGLFVDVGPMNPHTYRPNEFFSVDWVYEGLVAYGKGGRIIPSLATSWKVQQPAGGAAGQVITFNLRKGVQFHDGRPWNAQAAKANFDHVLQPGVRENHNWLQLVNVISSWKVLGEHTFQLTLNDTYYPALQELTFIRPFRMVSPGVIPTGKNENTCSPDWGVDGVIETSGGGKVLCKGLKGVAGTGPWRIIEKRTTQRVIPAAAIPSTQLEKDETVDTVLFTRNNKYWGTKPDIENIMVQRFTSQDAVMEALIDGSLDIAYGSGPMNPEDFYALQQKPRAHLTAHLSDPLNTRVIVINSGKFPTNFPEVRKGIIHGVNKPKILKTELYGMEERAETLFPTNLPFCDVPLNPPIRYDVEKAELMLTSAGWQYMSSDEVSDLASFVTSRKAIDAPQEQNTSFQVPDAEKAALLSVKKGFQKDPFGILRGWTDDKSPCDPPGWTGIKCRCGAGGCNVVEIDIGSAQLEGTLHEDVGALAHLETLWVNANELTGPLPKSIGKLTKLQRLSTRGNYFSGPIPEELGSLPALEIIQLQMNRHTGPIPASLGKLVNLTTLNLGFNDLSDPIPSQLAAAKKLKTLVVAQNPKLSGEIPEGILQNNLTTLDVRDTGLEEVKSNKLGERKVEALLRVSKVMGVSSLLPAKSSGQGKVPPGEKAALLTIKAGVTKDPYNLLYSWASATEPCDPTTQWAAIACTCITPTSCHITGIDVGSANLDGVLAPEVGSLSHLETFWINGNRLSGQIPESVGNLVNMTGWSTRGNFFTGAFPDSVRNLKNVQYIMAQYNFHSGQLPEGISEMESCSELNFGFNNLSGPVPGWLGDMGQLESVVLAFNQLTGKIPASVARLADLNLQQLDLRGNPLVTDAKMYTEEELMELAKVPNLLLPSQVSGTRATGPVGAGTGKKQGGSRKTPGWVVAVVVVAAALVATLVGALAWVIRQERLGNPLFKPLLSDVEGGPAVVTKDGSNVGISNVGGVAVGNMELAGKRG